MKTNVKGIKAMLADVLGSYRQAMQRFGPFLAVHVFFRLVSAGILVPVIGVLAAVAISISGQSALTDQDIAHFLVTPAGGIVGLTMLSLLLVSSVLDVAMMTVILRSGQLHTLAALATAIGFILRAITALARFAANLLIRLLVISIPFLLFSLTIYLLLLQDYDINYYISNKPSEFLLATVLITIAAVILASILLRRLFAWAMTLHLILFDDQPVAAAFRESDEAMRGKRLALFSRVCIWLLVRLLVASFLAFVAVLALAILPDMLGTRLPLIAGVLIVVLLLWTTLDLMVSAVANGALADLLNDNFNQALAGRQIGKEVKPGAEFSWKSPVAAALAACIGLAMASAAVGGVLLDNIQADHEVAIIGHRGAAGSRPENTLAAVKKAIEDGADWVEIDVQETADGEVVVIHDSDFMKAAGVNLKVWNATMQDLADIDIGSRFDPIYADQRPPLLRDVLSIAKDRVQVLIELKYYGHDIDLEKRVIQLVEEADMADQIATMSLKYAAVKKMRRLRPDWRTGVLAATSIGNLSGLQGNFIAINLGKVSRPMLKRAQAAGKDVYAWTVNDPITMSRMMSMGVDGLITDKPELARQVMEYRTSLDATDRMLLWISDRFSLALNINDADEVEQ